TKTPQLAGMGTSPLSSGSQSPTGPLPPPPSFPPPAPPPPSPVDTAEPPSPLDAEDAVVVAPGLLPPSPADVVLVELDDVGAAPPAPMPASNSSPERETVAATSRTPAHRHRRGSAGGGRDAKDDATAREEREGRSMASHGMRARCERGRCKRIARLPHGPCP